MCFRPAADAVGADAVGADANGAVVFGGDAELMPEVGNERPGKGLCLAACVLATLADASAQKQ